MLGEERFEVTRESHVVTDENTVSGDHAEPHALVVGVPEADSESDALVFGVEFKQAKSFIPSCETAYSSLSIEM